MLSVGCSDRFETTKRRRELRLRRANASATIESLRETLKLNATRYPCGLGSVFTDHMLEVDWTVKKG